MTWRLALIFGLSAALWWTALNAAFGHSAPSGWSYDWECCSTMDCAPVPDAAVREAAGGYSVRVEPGQHPMVTGSAVTGFIAHGDSRIRVSGDSDRHVCISRAGTLLCIYVPPGGV